MIRYRSYSWRHRILAFQITDQFIHNYIGTKKKTFNCKILETKKRDNHNPTTTKNHLAIVILIYYLQVRLLLIQEWRDGVKETTVLNRESLANFFSRPLMLNMKIQGGKQTQRKESLLASSISQHKGASKRTHRWQPSHPWDL